MISTLPLPNLPAHVWRKFADDVARTFPRSTNMDMDEKNRGREPAPHGASEAHCCYIPEGAAPEDESQHCNQPATIEISGPDGSEDYTHACGDHAGEMRRPGDSAYRLRDGKEIPE